MLPTLRVNLLAQRLGVLLLARRLVAEALGFAALALGGFPESDHPGLELAPVLVAADAMRLPPSFPSLRHHAQIVFMGLPHPTTRGRFRTRSGGPSGRGVKARRFASVAHER